MTHLVKASQNCENISVQDIESMSRFGARTLLCC